MFQALRNSPALRLLLLAGAGVLAFILAVHFFSKKSAASTTTSTTGDTSGNPPEHITVLINGYPAMQTPPGTVGGGTGNPTTPAPVPQPPIIAPGPGGVHPGLPPGPVIKPPTTPIQGQPIVKGVIPPPTSAQHTPVIAAPTPVITSPVVQPQQVTMANPAQVQNNIAVSQARVAAADAKVNPTPAPAPAKTYSKPAPKPVATVVTVAKSASSAVKKQVATVNARLARAGF